MAKAGSASLCARRPLWAGWPVLLFLRGTVARHEELNFFTDALSDLLAGEHREFPKLADICRRRPQKVAR